MTEQKFINLFIQILQDEYAKHPNQDITGWKAIDVIKDVFKELAKDK